MNTPMHQFFIYLARPASHSCTTCAHNAMNQCSVSRSCQLGRADLFALTPLAGCQPQGEAHLKRIGARKHEGQQLRSSWKLIGRVMQAPYV